MIQMNIKENVLDRILSPIKNRKAANKTLHKLGELCRNRTRSYILDEYNYKRENVQIKLEVHTNSALLIASRKRPSFMDFGAIQTPRGVTAFIRKSKPTSRKRAFIAKGRAPVIMAFQRKGKPRLPVRKLSGPSTGELMRSKYNMQQLNGLMRQRGQQVFADELIKI